MSKSGYQRMNKLNNFGPVYLINLPDHKHRLKNAKEQFNKYGISDYTIVEAVDGRKSTLSEIVEGNYPNLKSSEIGCLASHIKALSHWLDTSDSDYAIIMEDDFSFDTVEYWSFDWNYFISNMPIHAEIIQLVMIKNDPIRFNMHVKERQSSSNNMNYEWSTACYVIKRQYAKNLVKLHKHGTKYSFDSYGFKNQAADVILYGLGNAYSMPLFTHILDEKHSINAKHGQFHARSKNTIDAWWKTNGVSQNKESLFNLKENISNNKNKTKGCFTIFHVDGVGNNMEKRNMLVQKAKLKLLPTFDELDTPTIIMKDKQDVANFYKKSKIKIDPLGHFGDGWKPGELGIWASNIKAWENLLLSDYDYVVLMEDDIVLNKDFSGRLSELLEETPVGWDFFTAYVPASGNIRYHSNIKELDIGSNTICKVYQSWSCLCYVVSRDGAKKLLKEIKKNVKSPIDNYLFYHQNLNGYTINMEVKSLCEIYPTTSTVQSAKKIDMTGAV